jgi:hypothetical protein
LSQPDLEALLHSPKALPGSTFSSLPGPCLSAVENLIMPVTTFSLHSLLTRLLFYGVRLVMLQWEYVWRPHHVADVVTPSTRLGLFWLPVSDLFLEGAL